MKKDKKEIIKEVNELLETPTEYHCAGCKNSDSIRHFTYGSFPFQYNLTFGRLQISVTGENGHYRYLRTCSKNEITKEAGFSAQSGNLLIHPVQPNHLPSSFTDFLEIKFKPFAVEPNSSCVIFLTFPVELACLLESETGNREILDIFSAVNPKYSLYGTSDHGVLTRYHESEIYFTLPSVKNYRYGVLRLTIENNSGEWTTVGRVVLYLKGLKLFFDDVTIGAAALMRIAQKDAAHTTFTPGILCDNMKPAVYLFEERNCKTFGTIPENLLNDTVFTMDSGLI